MGGLGCFGPVSVGLGCFGLVLVVCNGFGLVWIGLGWFGLVGAGLDWGWIEGKWDVIRKMQLVDTIALKEKWASKGDRFLVTK